MQTSTERVMPSLTYWQDSVTCCDEEWEKAYTRFETPSEEIQKFTRRLKSLGAATWPANARILDLFCGRGNGLKCLEKMAFSNLRGVDLSDQLLSHYRGPASLFVGDCRDLKLPDQSVDIVIVQGGLHHLPQLPEDLAAVLRETRRVLVDGGRLVAVEPWLTPFLHVVHKACDQSILKNAWKKLDALAVMNEREKTTYDQWLKQPEAVLAQLDEYYVAEQKRLAWGKLMYVGRKAEIREVA
jgi:ubiquinone/menaquinone biosynthesis C-methylase UbiE